MVSNPASSPARLRIVFAGTPAFAVPSLTSLLAHPAAEVVAVFTQPDRAAGRGRQLRASAVKLAANTANLPIEQPPSWREPAVLATLRAYRPDLLVVAAYGLILPADSLEIPQRGAINVHASLLPRWRGAAPIQRAIMAGDRVTGVTIMQVVPALDAGPMLAHRSCSIEEQDTGGSLERKLAELGGELLGEVITRLAASPVEGRIQDPALVTYAAKISRTDRDLEWGRTASELARQVRALNPEPLALTNLRGLSVAISEAEALPAMTGAIAPGTILAWDPTGIVVATGAGRLRVLALQPSGKRVMSVRDFVNGYRHLRPL